MTFEESCRETAQEVAELIIQKHRDYGPDNILVFKEQGLIVRLWDKIGRLKHLLWTNSNPNYDSVVDSFTDIAGYGIIGLMLQKETFTNEMTQDGV